MKKFIALILAAVLVLGSALPVMAAESSSSSSTSNSGNTIRLNLASIESIMLSSSSNMALAKNNLDKSNLTYSTALSDYNKVKKQYDAMPLTTPAEWATAKSLSDQLDALRNSLNSAKFNLDAAKLVYDQQVGQFVLAAQGQYLSYLSAQTQNQITLKSLSAQESQLAGLQARLKIGYISKKQVDTFATQVSDLKISLANQEEQTSILLNKLRSALGISEAATVTVDPVTSFDFSAIPLLVVADDLKAVLANSVSIKTAEISLQSINKLASGSYDPYKYRYDIIAAELALAQTREKVKLDFQDQYSALKTAYAALQTRITKLNVKNIELTGMQLKQKFGFASNKQVQDLQLEVNNQELQILLDRLNLSTSYLSYVSKKQGN